MKHNIFLYGAAALLLFSSCQKQPKADNVIFLIGDGMGLGAVSSLIVSESEPTAFELAPVVGLSETGSANSYVTDSPAGGTALATGTRTLNGYLGLDPNDQQLESILKKAQTLGKKTGIVVNTVLTEATPASFYGGVTSRSQSQKLAEQFVESGVDVAIGGGIEPFIYRADSLDLTEALINKGYDVYLDWPNTVLTESQKFVSFLPSSNIHRRNKRDDIEAGAAETDEVCIAAKMAAEHNLDDGSIPPLDPSTYLTKAVEKAISVLEKSKNGYFLMIESAIIDGYGHNNDSEGMIEEMKEYDQTLRFLAEYAATHPGTLVVTTADHETGGVSIPYQDHEVNKEEGAVSLAFSTKGHSGALVPIFAFGTCAEKFGRVMKNCEVPGEIWDAMNGK